MCGILGLIADPGTALDLERSQMEFMRDAMQARGPDGAGLLIRDDMAFAHRRLAIRDLDFGQQPWLSADEQCVLVYNGEIYNDAELRTELAACGHTFRTRCDTEVLMAAYRQWGSACLERLRGMFAFAVYDFRERSLFLARDRFGVKPLFFARLGRAFAFASTVKALVRHPRFHPQPNQAAVSHYLTTFRPTLERETLYQGIWQLLPGESLSLRDGVVTIDRYWDYPQPAADSDDEQEFETAAAALREILSESIALRLASDVPVGMFLSGGVDSNTLACLLREQTSRSLLAKCAGGGESPDFEHARQCAAHVEFDYDEVRVPAGEYFDCWQWMIGETALPLATPTDVLLFRLARDMKQHVGVVLGGEGADELFCGYAVQHWSGQDYDRLQAIEQGRWQGGPRAERQFRASLRQQYGRDHFASQADLYFCLNSLIPVSVKPALFQTQWWEAAGHDAGMVHSYSTMFEEREEQPAIECSQRVLHRVNLESLLARLDSATMLAGLEARVPYTDHVLVERMFQVPISHKIGVAPYEPDAHLTAGELERRGSLRSKRILRHTAESLMPPHLARRKKASFPTPVQSWLAGPWQEWASRTLLQSEFAHQTFRPEAIAQLAGNVAQAGMWLWPLLNTVCWGDRHLAA